MSACLIFNHHSLPFTQLFKAKDAIPDFLKICAKANQCGKETILIDQAYDRHWFHIELAPGYTWKHWHDSVLASGDDTWREQIRVFRSIATRQPLLSQEDIMAGADLLEVLDSEKNPVPVALLAACWHEAPLVSFATAERWEKHLLPVSMRRLDSAGNLLEQSGTITNIYSSTILEGFIPAWLEARNATLRRGRDLWNNRARLYPHLIFCGKTESQLCGWQQVDTVFDQVKQVLDVFEQFSRDWHGGKIATYSHEILREMGLPHRISGESESCNTSKKRKDERTFYLPTGKKAYFENHVKLANGQRLHFFPDETSRQIHVGYIGAHLS